jgi:hypothetical protein
MPKPTQLPEWATGAGADVSEPNAARKALGWVAGLVPPAGHQNWWQNLVYDWLAWLETAPIVYTSQEEAIAGTESGDVVVVDEVSESAGEEIDTIATPGQGAGTDVVDVCCDGARIVYVEAGGTVARGALRDAPDTPTITYTKTNAGVAVRIVSDGDRVLLCYGNYLECFNAATGASVWVYDHTAPVRDACFWLDRVYLTGDRTAGNVTTRYVSRAAGGGAVSIDHGANTVAICAANSRVFIAGSGSVHPTGATVRALDIDTLGDETGECGVLDASGHSWNSIQVPVQARPGTLASDGRYLYCGYPEGGVYTVDARDLTDGTLLEGKLLTNHRTVRLALDREYLIVGTIDTGFANRGWVHGYTPRLGARAWNNRDSAKQLEGVSTDGSRAWACYQIAPGELAIKSISRGLGASALFRRVEWDDAGDSLLRPPSSLRRLLLPLE